MTVAHRALIVGGLAVLAVGIVLLVYVSQHWDYIVSIVKFSGALQAATAAGGFGIIGVALLYAGTPKKTPVPI